MPWHIETTRRRFKSRVTGKNSFQDISGIGPYFSERLHTAVGFDNAPSDGFSGIQDMSKWLDIRVLDGDIPMRASEDSFAAMLMSATTNRSKDAPLISLKALRAILTSLLACNHTLHPIAAQAIINDAVFINRRGDPNFVPSAELIAPL